MAAADIEAGLRPAHATVLKRPAWDAADDAFLRVTTLALKPETLWRVEVLRSSAPTSSHAMTACSPLAERKPNRSARLRDIRSVSPAGRQDRSPRRASMRPPKHHKE
jgi:hypothetical protein